MNFDFSDDQKSLKDEARKFLAAKCPPTVVRALLDDPAPGFDRALWDAIAEQGWLGAAIPEAFGGLGLGYLELCCIAEELGRAVAPVPFASTVYFLAEALLLAGSDEQKRALLPKIVAGQVIGAFATSERPGPVGEAGIEAVVSGGKLTGSKLPVTDGGIADVAVVLAREAGQLSLFLVDLNGQGVSRTTLDALDNSRNLARIDFADAPAESLGAAGAGLTLYEQITERAAILLAFEQLGGADRVLEVAKAYVLERYAFGRQIGSYQAIKHRLADMYTKNVLARGNAYYGAWALNSDRPETPLAAAQARIAASEAYWYGAKENVQVHGGMGFTWELDCHLHYRRSQQLALVAGAPRQWKERLVSRLERNNVA